LAAVAALRMAPTGERVEHSPCPRGETLGASGIAESTPAGGKGARPLVSEPAGSRGSPDRGGCSSRARRRQRPRWRTVLHPAANWCDGDGDGRGPITRSSKWHRGQSLLARTSGGAPRGRFVLTPKQWTSSVPRN
jgi:hypothetical protein